MTKTKEKTFLATWPLGAILAPYVLSPIGSVISVALFVAAVVLLTKDPQLNNVARIATALLWISSITCFVYAILAFGSMVEAADNMSPNTSWTQGFLPIIIAGVIALIASAFIVLKEKA
ncbi:hypothetical protein JTE88_01635 [Arcanobacterium phocisimile]|uniref:Uncharacterized protein n=1 Tax=Arcanobacterium phocisimile TaxID=1302235 RepID=A0ABX7IH85_9ACTO|nr:hypothetical protein [Arcanobacterium phocisimile]QRV02486.1 hypothetical protein JTE88_01635 [Arcanobacterium phocisimile]